MTRRFIVLFILTLIFSCASRRGLTVYQPEAVSQVRKVAMAPIRFDISQQQNSNVKLILSTAIIRAIEAHGAFSITALSNLPRNATIPDIVDAAQEAGYDAILFSAAAFDYNRLPGMNPIDCRVTLRMVELQERQVMVVSDYSTADAPPYKSPAGVEKVIFDAAVGALKPLLALWR